jgi:hypothetical protein
MSQSFEQRVETLKETLATRFGYGRKEAKSLAIEALTKLDNYVNTQELMIKRIREYRKK